MCTCLYFVSENYKNYFYLHKMLRFNLNNLLESYKTTEQNNINVGVID